MGGALDLLHYYFCMFAIVMHIIIPIVLSTHFFSKEIITGLGTSLITNEESYDRLEENTVQL